MMIRWRVRFLRSSSSLGRQGRAVGGTAMVRPVVARDSLGGRRRRPPSRRSIAGIDRLDRAAVGEAEEVGPELLGRSVAVGRVLGHRLHDHGLERRRDGRVGHPRQDRLVAHVLGGDRDRASRR